MLNCIIDIDWDCHLVNSYVKKLDNKLVISENKLLQDDPITLWGYILR